MMAGAVLASLLVTAAPVPAQAVVPTGMPSLRSSLDTGGASYGTLIADVTGDGLADLIVTHHASSDPDLDHAILVYAQEAGGSLAAEPAVYHLSIGAASDASRLFPAVGDVDGDGDTDLVVGHQSGLNIFRQAGGVFATRSAISTVYAVHQVVVADLNSDGLQDIFYSQARPTGGYRYLRRLQKADHSIDGWQDVGYSSAERFVVGDVNGDTFPDVVAVGDTEIFLHAADSQNFTETIDARIAGAVAGRIGDVDGDTRNDLLLLEPDAVRLMEGKLDGTLDAPVTVADGFDQAAALGFRDVNADGTDDAVVSSPDATRVFLQDEAGTIDALACTYAAVQPSPVGGNETFAVGDLNDDGLAEAVGAQEGSVLRRLDPQGLGNTVAATVDAQAAGPVEVGHDVTVSGSVHTPGGSCGFALGSVDLERTLPGGGPQIVATAPLTGPTADGTSAAFTFTDTPAVAGSVTYRVLFDGDTFHDQASSDPVDVDVTKHPSALALKATDTTIPAGATSTLVATLSGGDRPADVTFSKIVSGVREEIGTAAVGDDDKARLDVSPQVTMTYIATYAATDTAKGATSNKITVEVAKRESKLGLSAPTRVEFGDTARLKARLTGGTGTRKVSFFVLRDGERVLLGRVAASATGVATFDAKPTKNAKYVATYAGDGIWSSATSPTRTVKVRVVTTGRMVHFGRQKDGYAYYVCCRAYFAFKVAPNHAGFRVLVESEYLDGSVWKAFDGSSRYFKLRPNSTQEIFTDISGGRDFKFRIRACLDTHADHDGDCSGWVKFRFE
jgi:hypothetical protein